MKTDFAEQVECVARELKEFAQEMRHAVEGGWRWSPATFAAMEAVRESNRGETESGS